MTGFLLDTNVISELSKRQCHPAVKGWADEQDQSALFISDVTVGEIRKGIARLPAGERRSRIERDLEGTLMPAFAGRILPVDLGVWERWGMISGRAAARGQTLPVFDALLAALALQHGLVLVTRNTKDIRHTGARWFDPWTGGG